MKLKSCCRVIGVGAALSLVLTSCADGDDRGGQSSGGSSSGDIVFGQLIGVTGDYAPFTPPAVAAFIDHLRETLGGVPPWEA